MRKRRFDKNGSPALRRVGCSSRSESRGCERRSRPLGNFEQMEPRYLLTADPVDVGAVYIEEDTGSDQHGDTFELSFVGGATDTQLTQVVIDGDQNAPGFGLADVFFDTVAGGLGADDAFPLNVLAQDGVDSVSWAVSDGGASLVLDFIGFDAGDRFVFSIDVDEVQEFEPLLADLDEVNEGFDPITSGVEFQGSLFTARFTAPNYFNVEGTTEFRNRYDAALAATDLDLPEDNINGKRDRTAGAVQNLLQDPIPVSISGYVYHDLDDDGHRESDEPGIANVPVQVVPIDTIEPQAAVTVTTRGDGFYETTGLMPGTYRVIELDQPSPYLDGTDEAGTVDGAPRGFAVNPGDELERITLDGGQVGVDYNFGEVLAVAIHGRVHLSTEDGDCFGATESHEPVAGARVHLHDQTGDIIQSTLTNANGEYWFEGMRPGVYRIVEETSDGLISGASRQGTVNGSPVGTVISDDIVANIHLQSGQVALQVDFCEHVPAELSGHVYHDLDDDGRRQTGEEGIGQVRVVLLDADGLEVADQTTDNDGFYRFTGLRAGDYTVVEEHPTDWLDGTDAAGTIDSIVVGTAINPGDRIEEVSLKWGDQGFDYDFGELQPSRLSGRVHLSSRDGDCFGEEADHRPIEGAVVRLLDANGNLLEETKTDADGEYIFDNLAPGRYSIFEITPSGMIDGGAHAGDIDGADAGSVIDAGTIASIDLLSGQHGFNYDFCEHEPAMISGHVYHDANVNGRRELGEQPIADVEILLKDASGNVVASTRSDDTGFYKFQQLRAGEYQLMEMHPDGWLDGTDVAGTVAGVTGGAAQNPGDQISNIDLLWGDNGVDYDFGELQTGGVSGRVHLSTRDGDCFGDEEDHRPIEGAVVRLLDAEGNLLEETTTDANGEYNFVDLAPGRYSIVELTPGGLIDGGAHRGDIDGTEEGSVIDEGTIANIDLLSGQRGVNYDFCEHEPAMISGHVYHDHNDNGLREAGDEGIAGVEVLLKDRDGNVIDSTRSDDLGFYKFRGLRAGEYRLMEMQPDGWLDGTDVSGTIDGDTVGTAENPGDQIGEIVLAWGDNGIDYDFAELLPATIAGLVHTDIGIRDCHFDQSAGEISLDNVRIQLIDADGEIPEETLTNSAGRYQFVGVRPGQYTIRQIQPDGYFDGAQVAGSHGGNDTGINEITEVVVASGQELVHYNFCEESPVTLSGYVFQDGDTVFLSSGAQLPDRIRDIRDGQRTTDDTPLSGVVIELRDGFTAAELTSDRYLPGRYAEGVIRFETDVSGFYEFTGLRRGSYAVYEFQPAGFIDGVDTQGSASGLVFNAGESINVAASSLLEVDPQFDAIVRINLAPGAVSVENNFSEIKVEDTTFIPPRENPPVKFNPLVLNVVIDLPTIDPPQMLNNYVRQPLGDGSGSAGNTWHLSVIDAGHPRGDGVLVEDAGAIWFVSASSSRRQISETTLQAGHWTVLRTGDGPAAEDAEEFKFGIPGAIPVAGDFDGDGFFEIGVFLKGKWFIDLNGNGVWDRDDLWAKLGYDGDFPVTGDWDGDGKHDIGIFGRAWPGDPKAVAREPGLPDRQNRPDGRQKNVPPDEQDATSGHRLMKLTADGDTRADLIDHVFHYGLPRDYPVTGDWNGDGITSIGIFRNGRWHVDLDGNGRWSKDDEVHHYGRAGDIPVVGDFNGDGVDDFGIFRNGVFYLDTNGNRELDANDQIIKLGGATDKPVAGDWDGDGIDEVAVYRDGEPAPDAQARKAG